MKKIIALSVCILLLTACTALKNNAGNDNRNTVTDSAITGSSITASAVSSSTVSATAVSGTSIGEQEERENKEEKQKVVIVTDETGKKRELKLGDVNVEDAGVYLVTAGWVTNYSQVIDGHYYYLRYEENEDGENIYAIYQDKGEKVGRFTLDEYCEPSGFVKYGKNYFVLLYYFDYSNKGDFLAYVDLQKEKVNIICDVTDAHLVRSENIVFCNIYKNAFYFDKRDVWDEYMMRPGDSVKYDFVNDNSQMESIPMSLNAAKASPYWTYMDGKIYYGVADGRKVTLFSHALESGKEREIFYYERKKKYETNVVYLAIDEDYIYCQDYLIPRSGGKMVKVFQNAKIENPTIKEMPQKVYGEMYYTYNQKYIFYIDKKDKVHRISKATKEDIVISKLKADGVDCTEDSVYVKVHAKEWYSKSRWEEFEDDDEGDISTDSYSNHLYCMDLDGKNVKRIWKGSWKD